VKRVFFALLLIGAATPALAVEVPTTQWKPSSLSLFELVQNGYTIVAVTGEELTQMFYVQKSGNVYKCLDTHLGDQKANNFTASFNCWQLAKPFAAAKLDPELIAH
jgi:hypothetical protein